MAPAPAGIRRAPRAVRLALVCALAAFVAYTALVGGALGAEPSREIRGALYTIVFGLCAGVCAMRALRIGAERWAWVAFGGAHMLSICAWIVYWLLVEPLDATPYPSASDALWLSNYFANYVGLVLLMRARATRFGPRLWVDGVVGALTLGALSAAFLLEPLTASTGASFAAAVTNLTYPIADVVMVAMILVLIRLTGWRPDRSFTLIGASFCLLALADSLYLHRAASGEYLSGTLLDASWPAATLLIAWAAWQPARPVREMASDGWREFAVPAAFALLPLAVLIYGALFGVPVVATLLATGALLGLLVRTAFGVSDMRRLERRHEEAVGASLTDSLTGLRNHRAFHEDLGTRLGEAARSGEPMVLVMVDLVGLKRTNDALGHQAGDRRLLSLSRQLAASIRRGDQAYRVGGDEFAVVLSEAGAWEGFNFAERTQAKLSGGYVTTAPAMSAGIAESGKGIVKDELIRRADIALVEAKRSQRKAVVYSEAVEPDRDATTPATQSTHTKRLATSLARAVDAKDSYTRSHCETVSEICVLIAERLGLDSERVSNLRLAGLLHDVGKIGIPDSILQKPGPLTDAEFECMKTHPVLGYDIVAATGLEEQARWVRHHHERPDGRGYPDGLAGEAVPLESRVILVADAFEAITADRPYRRGRPVADALAEIRRHAGSQFDPDCVRALEDALASGSEAARRDSVALAAG